ncbi:hypothetical protein CVT25_011503 [Psilocybe cyanescens]|uniref:AB hydrolase-1 domain-containing protein n=1 Tax=Psilocybe cyanescens TaxID=93625 RepID=A0A409WAI2_PSICY|nr:hypothetical protein CVT25_011503 [Psilocybe cyanescens]
MEDMVLKTETIVLTQPMTGLISLAIRYSAVIQPPESLTIKNNGIYPSGRSLNSAQISSARPGPSTGKVTVTLSDYTNILRCLLESQYLKGKCVMVVRHSSSTLTWTLAVLQAIIPALMIKAAILVEAAYVLPPLGDNNERITQGIMNKKGVKSRKHTFPSRDKAAKWCCQCIPWKVWDKHIFKCYMVALNCTLEQELNGYAPNVPLLAGHLYPKLCVTYSVHGIFGECPELYSNATRDRFFNGKDRQVMASVQIMPKAGHLLMQEVPETAAEMVAKILKNSGHQHASPTLHL